MAKIRLNKILEAIRGHIGRIVFRVRPDGTVIISGVPRYKGRPGHKGTPAQRAHRNHVKQIGPYAKHLARIHPIYAELAAGDVARGKWMSPYNFAFADCMKPPVVHHIERREGCIRVQATDNIGVTRVRVAVLDEAGKTLEIGDAIRAEGDWWEYVPHAEGKRILAKAFDLPGNCTRLEL
jgi:hypothetical protein